MLENRPEKSWIDICFFVFGWFRWNTVSVGFVMLKNICNSGFWLSRWVGLCPKLVSKFSLGKTFSHMRRHWHCFAWLYRIFFGTWKSRSWGIWKMFHVIICDASHFLWCSIVCSTYLCCSYFERSHCTCSPQCLQCVYWLFMKNVTITSRIDLCFTSCVGVICHVLCCLHKSFPFGRPEMPWWPSWDKKYVKPVYRRTEKNRKIAEHLTVMFWITFGILG